MTRPTASNVSALSSVVANSRQTIQSFPPLSLKFRTAGFPQYGFKRAVSRALRRRPAGFDAATVALSSMRVLIPQWDVRPAALMASEATHPPSGPWLRQRLFCPPASWLTMATSELLAATVSLWIIPTALRRPEGPQFTLSELDCVPSPLLRRFSFAGQRVCANGLAFTHPVGVRQPLSPPSGSHGGLLTKLQRSLDAAARNLAGPAPDGTFTTELAHAGSLRHTSVMTT
jgi:hypothetical protein